VKDARVNEWPRITLGELTERRPICYGVLKPGERQSEGVPLLRITDIKNNSFDTSNIYLITEELSHEFKRSVLVGGEVLLSIQGTIGRVAICPKEYAGANISRTIALIDPDDRIDRRFLRYCLLSMDGTFPVGGATRASLNIGDIRKLRVPLPSLEEQQRIVAVLDEAFEGLARARAHAEANLQNAREFFEAELYHVFEHALSTAPERTFEEITSDSLIGLVRSKKEQGTEKQFDYVKMQNIGNDDRYLGGVVDRIDCSPEEEARYQIKRGDLLFNTRNSRELVGKSCIIEQDFERPTVFNNNIMRVRFSSNIYPRYVALAFRSGPVKAQLEAMKSGTTSVVAIYHKSLKKLRLPMPDQQEQRTLVDRFDELDSAVQCLVRNYKRQVDDISDLRQSLLQKAFAGELT
jgi:type I restriction enzyme S subunit